MTTPSPTPAQMQKAREIAQDIYNATNQSQRNDEYDKYQRKAFDNLVAPILARALADAERETVEECCKAVCSRCSDGLGFCETCQAKGCYYHTHTNSYPHHIETNQCDAAAIRAAFAERKGER